MQTRSGDNRYQMVAHTVIHDSSVTDVLFITITVQGHTYRCRTRTVTAERGVTRYEVIERQNVEQDFRVVCVSITKMQLLQGTFFRIIVI